MPIRIQRKRTKGWKMPENTVSVCRPGPFGNPFRIGGWFAVKMGNMHNVQAAEGYQDSRFTKVSDAETAVRMYRESVQNHPPRNLELLRGKNLACWCKIGSPCHADILLEIANS